jgi:hypothetical protein
MMIGERNIDKCILTRRLVVEIAEGKEAVIVAALFRGNRY